MATRAITFPTTAPATLPRASGLATDAVLMLAAALLLRCWWFNNPVVQIDEQFYLVVGDRVLHGAIPFVDIWDRKPVGLFLAYAAIRLLGGDGILQYQLVAAGLAALVAWLVTQVARLHAGETAARLAGVAALLWMPVFDGAGGQAPIIYGPLVAGAALVTLRVVLDRTATTVALFGRGCLAMLLIGLAMQVKYTALFEGLALGLMLLWAAWARRRPVALTLQVAGWATLALLPTAAAYLWYHLHGFGPQFVYANFVSIGQRPPTPPSVIRHRLFTVTAYALPLLVAALVALRQSCPDEEVARARRYVACWALAGVIGFLGIGTFFTHYFLPAVLPLAALAAPAIDRGEGRHPMARRWPAALMLAIGAVLAVKTGLHRVKRRGDGQQVQQMAEAIRPRLTGCLFVFDGEPILYQLTRACMATAYIFPNHLNEWREAAAVGIDPLAETRRVLATRPQFIVGSSVPDRGFNPYTLALVRAELARHYRPILRVPVHRRIRIVYQRLTPS